jgi:hypothetical protein
VWLGKVLVGGLPSTGGYDVAYVFTTDVGRGAPPVVSDVACRVVPSSR